MFYRYSSFETADLRVLWQFLAVLDFQPVEILYDTTYSKMHLKFND